MESPTPWPRPQQHNHHLPTTNRKRRAIDELVRGRDMAYNLQLALKKSLADSTLSAYHHQDLVSKILGSFNHTLSILESDEFPAVNSHSSDARKSEDSTGSCKHSQITSKDRRGCYKRRKTSETWSKETSSLIDDGHAWRKYGQKVILHSQHPRSYFRCTHKYDQECQATKQVQMIQENPPIYRTTYHGRHTCKNLLKTQQIILETTTAMDSSVLLRFDQSIDDNDNNNVSDPFLAAVYPLTKQETKEEDLNADYFLSPELTGAMSSALSAGSDHGDVLSSGVYSCSASASPHESLGIDLVDDLEDVFPFEF